MISVPSKQTAMEDSCICFIIYVKRLVITDSQLWRFVLQWFREYIMIREGRSQGAGRARPLQRKCFFQSLLNSIYIFNLNNKIANILTSFNFIFWFCPCDEGFRKKSLKQDLLNWRTTSSEKIIYLNDISEKLTDHQ